jgi:protein-S-isoprenylcysteine O-methyltransferase Ste14
MKPAIVAQSAAYNLGVVAIGFVFAWVSRQIDALLHIREFYSLVAMLAGWLLIASGLLIRVWATGLFLEQRMTVISLHPQTALITTGPYRFTRNPLYLGGNVFLFLGVSLLFGSPTAAFVTALNVVAVALMVRREERQLTQQFGEDFLRYKGQVRRWL